MSRTSLFEVVIVFGELGRQRVQQFRVDRRIADAHVVHFVDDAAAEEVGPDDVGQIRGEVRVLGRCQPLGHHLAAILAAHIGHVAAEKLRRHDAAVDGCLHLAAAAVEDDRLARILALFAADLRKERGEAVVVIHRPAVERMIVALGALNPHAHEHLGDVLGDLQRVGFDSGSNWWPRWRTCRRWRQAAPGPSGRSARCWRACSCSQL